MSDTGGTKSMDLSHCLRLGMVLHTRNYQGNSGGFKHVPTVAQSSKKSHANANISGGRLRNEREGFAVRCLTYVSIAESAIVHLPDSELAQ